VCLIKMKRERYLWIALLPMAWLVICTLTAGWQKVFSGDARVSFVAHAQKFAAAIDAGQILAPAKTLDEMRRIVRNDTVDAALALIFMLLVIAIIGLGLRATLAARKATMPTAREAPYVGLAGAEL